MATKKPKKSKKHRLALYVWKDVLTDYTSGVMFALAHSEAEARRLVLTDCPHASQVDLALDPDVYLSPIGFAVWGGG